MTLDDQRTNLTALELAALDRFVRDVRADFGDRVRRVRLFGSRSRGEGHEESDLDVLVLIDTVTPKERDQVIDRSCDVWSETGVDVSPLVREPRAYAELLARERLIALDIERDGIDL